MPEEIESRGFRSKLRIWGISTYAAAYATAMAYTYASGGKPGRGYIYAALPLAFALARPLIRKGYAALDDWAYERQVSRTNSGSEGDNPNPAGEKKTAEEDILKSLPPREIRDK